MAEKCLARSRPALAATRHDDTSIRTFGLDLDAGILVPPQSPGWAHLVTVRSGSAQIRTERTVTTVTAATGAWIRDGVAYELAFASRTRLRIVYCAPAMCEPDDDVMEMSALMHELIERLTVRGYLDPTDARDARLLAVVRDELTHLQRVARPGSLALPRDPALRDSIVRYSQTIDEMPSVTALAATARMSVRTFERRFVAQTGCTPREWLRRARLIAAMAELASGASVTEAGFACGYASTSAFVTAYRLMFGVTPGRARRNWK